jgi:hypothetical protein
VVGVVSGWNEVPQVSRVLLRIEWADDQVREFDAEQPYDLDVKISRPGLPAVISPVPDAIFDSDALSVTVTFKVSRDPRYPLTIRTPELLGAAPRSQVRSMKSAEV